MRFQRRNFLGATDPAPPGQPPAGMMPDMYVPGPVSQVNAPQVQYIIDDFTYGINFLNLSNGATAIGNIQIDADSDFEWVKASCKPLTHGSDTELSLNALLATIQIQDSGAGRLLMNIPIQINTIFGSGQLPFILPVSRIFKARSNIQFTVVNTSAGVTYDIYLSLCGRKMFAQGIP